MRTPLTKQTIPIIPNNFSRKTKDKPNHAVTTHIKQPDKQNHKISKSTTHTKIKKNRQIQQHFSSNMEDNISQHATAKENGTNANFPNKLAMNYETPHYTTTSLSNNKLTKYEANQDTKPKTEYFILF